MKKRFLSGTLAVCITLSGLFAGCSNADVQVAETSDTTAESTMPTVITESTSIPTTGVVTEPAATITTESETEAATVPPIPVIIVEQESNLNTLQRDSLNMLNYITVLTQSINESSNSRIYLDSVKSSLLNNIYPNAVDTKTQGQINTLWNTIDEYRMVSVKRERLEYLYEQNRAQALRKAIPNPLGLLSAVESGNLLKTAVSVIYMAVDAKTSYDAATTEADLEYLKEGWELDDAEAKALSASQLNLLNYMIDVVRANDFPGEYALTEKAVEDFVKWSNEENLVRKINWLETKVETYREFRTYWLVLAKSYYEAENYEKCLESFEEYEEIATRIFRKDYDYAETIPMIISAAKETMPKAEYENFADKYVKILLENCSDDDWLLRYFAAQIYIDLSASTGDDGYLWKAYDIAYDNVNVLVDEQEALNIAYLSDVQEAEPAEGASKREKNEVKEYNKLLKETRKKELPPVSEAFYLNCDLLFALAEKLDIPESNRATIDDTIHENGKEIFLTQALDNRFWANTVINSIDSDDISIEFDGKKLVIPASCLTARSTITVTVSDGTILDDWIVDQVERPKDSTSPNEFLVTMTSAKAKDYDYVAGEKIAVQIVPVLDTPDNDIEFEFDVIAEKNLWVFDGIAIERKK